MTTVAIPVKLESDFDKVIGWLPIDHGQLHYPSVEVLKKPAIDERGWESYGRERVEFSRLIVPGSGEKIAIFVTDAKHPPEWWYGLKNFLRNPHYADVSH